MQFSNTDMAFKMLIFIILTTYLSFAVAATQLKSLTSSNRSRSYWVHLPSNYDKNQVYPVVIAFHGSSKIGMDVDGFAMEADTRLSLPIFTTKYSESVSLRIFLTDF